MKPRRLTEEQIIGILREQEARATTADVFHKHGVSSATIHNWKAKCGGMDVSDARWLTALEDENTKLAKLSGRDDATRLAHLHGGGPHVRGRREQVFHSSCRTEIRRTGFACGSAVFRSDSRTGNRFRNILVCNISVVSRNGLASPWSQKPALCLGSSSQGTRIHEDGDRMSHGLRLWPTAPDRAGLAPRMQMRHPARRPRACTPVKPHASPRKRC
ncbi:MAG: transposase [Rhodoplanes sp.]|nr:transposase [Rhodoplanes sp.]